MPDTPVPPGTARRPRRRATRAGRRLRHSLALALALVLLGVGYAVVAPRSPVAHAQDPALVREGQALYEVSCVTCHGLNLQGVPGRAPSIVGAGEASVYFQVSTGRMPQAGQSVQAQRKAPRFTPPQIDALGAFVQSRGGGPVAPAADGAALEGSDVSRGGYLFRLNCAQCHNFTGRGGALSEGKFAPVLDPATPRQMYSAMQSGPGAMPVFADTQLSPEEKRDIITYITTVKATGQASPGGNRLGGFGPVPEGLVAFAVGLGLLVALSLWIGSRR